MVKRFIGLVVVIILIVSAVAFKNSIYYRHVKSRLGYFFGTLTNKAQIIKHNIEQDVNPQRKPPLSFSIKEEKLKYFAPQVFGEFGREEWSQFWLLIYGHKKVGDGMIKQKAYRDTEEIKESLMYKYPDPFAKPFFEDRHWDYFWSIIFSR